MTAKEVAEWMAQQLDASPGQELFQEDAAWHIQEEFGQHFTRVNADGGLSIARRVLVEFRKLTADTVVWERGCKAWRKRQHYDPPKTRTAD
jgi:hypothetical protein